MFGMTVKGEYHGREVALWVSMLSGLEIISVDGREVSRRRSFGFSTAHDLSAAGIDVQRGVAGLLPLRLELRKEDEIVATLRHPNAMLVSSLFFLLLALGVLGGLLVGRLIFF